MHTDAPAVMAAARRTARLLVSEIRLYHEPAVTKAVSIGICFFVLPCKLRRPARR